MARTSDAELSSEDLSLLRAIATDDPMDLVARRLGLSERTLRRRARSLYDRLGVTGRVEAAVWGATRGHVRSTSHIEAPTSSP